MKLIDLTGQRFGRLAVVCRAAVRPKGGAYWACFCDCGKTVEVLGSNLRSGDIQSCGCLRSELFAAKKTTHGKARRGKVTPEYRAWCRMLARCHAPCNASQPNYAGRGIVVCQEWRDSFEAFLAHIGPIPSPHHSVDRFPNNDGNYEPGNVRWATRSQQNKNKRSARRAA